MAGVEYKPDPYNGWSVVSPDLGNVTAHQIMTDTSGQWQLTSIGPGFRTYSR